MATKKYSIDDYKDRWTSPIVSEWNPPKQSAKKKAKKSTKKGK